MAFLEATLAMLEIREGQTAQASSAYQPAPLDLWRVPEAIARVTALLAQRLDGLSLADCLPPIPASAAQHSLRQRAALASSLLASLELARDARLGLQQNIPFGPITLQARTGHKSIQDNAA